MATEREYSNDDKKTGSAIRCPKCKETGSVCRAPRQLADKGLTIRRRRCVKCRTLFNTVEMTEEAAKAALITAEELAEVSRFIQHSADTSNTTLTGTEILRRMMSKVT